MSTVDQALGYLADHRIRYKDISVTTGTSQFSGYYYNDANLSLPSGCIPLSASIIDAVSNRPAFAQLLDNTKVRVNSTYSNIRFSVRVFYSMGGVIKKFLFSHIFREGRCAA